MRLPKPTTVALLLAIFAGSEAHAEDATAVVDRVISLTHNLIGSIRKDFFEPTILMQKPSLLADEQSIEVFVTRDLRPGATAFVDGNKKYIYYNVGTTIAVLLYADYAAIRIVFGSQVNSDCRKYVDYLGDSLKTYGSLKPEDFYMKVVKPIAFCGVTDDSDGSILKSARDKISIETLVPVVALVLGHEMGHHLLGHLPPKKNSPKRAREIEGDADRFGSVLAAEKIVRAPASVIFSILAAARKGHPFDPGRYHDTAECRFLFFMKDDQRIHGEQIGAEILNSLRERKDIEDEVLRAINLVRNGVGDEEIASHCDIIK